VEWGTSSSGARLVAAPPTRQRGREVGAAAALHTGSMPVLSSVACAGREGSILVGLSRGKRRAATTATTVGPGS
jgi:hypothetical protein